jgi:uncharacterized membrane protein
MYDTVDTSSLLRCYVLLALGMPLTFIPSGPVGGLALLLMLVGIIWAYRLRKRDGELFASHSRWMIRTFWISGFLFLIAIALSGAIVQANGDNTAIEQIRLHLQNGTATPEEIRNLALQYQETNKTLTLNATLVCFAPAVMHALLRFIKGYRLADSGKPIENAASWTI